MPYQPGPDVVSWLYEWQTLIAGVLAVGAAVGTIWATIKSADREIASSKDQTAVAERQLQSAIQIEKQRELDARIGFLNMMQATMDRVVRDAGRGRELSRNVGPSGASTVAYDARQCFTKLGFPELRAACLTQGDLFTSPFFELERTIDEFAAQWTRQPTAGEPLRVGFPARLSEGIDGIERDAKAIQSIVVHEVGKIASKLAARANKPPDATASSPK